MGQGDQGEWKGDKEIKVNGRGQGDQGEWGGQ